jgi:hypothetical protein
LIQRRALLTAAVAPALVALSPARKQLLLSSTSRLPPGISLDLSFLMPGVLDPRITFTRASTGTYFDSSGTMRTATANTPRWDYDPGTLALRGMLIEEARTNILLMSADYTQAGWSYVAITGTPGQAGAPDGTATFTRMAETSAASAHYLGTAIGGLTASASYTLSVFARAQQDRYLQLSLDDANATGGYATFDLQAGVVSGALTARGTVTLGAATIQAIGGGTYRCAITTTIGAITTGRVLYLTSNVAAPAFAPSYAGNAANGLLVWGTQLTASAFPDSYIPTTVAAVTRAADIATMPTAAWFNLATGTYQAEYSALSATVGRVLQASDVGASNADMLLAAATATGSGNTFAAGANQGRIDSGPAIIPLQIVKSAYAVSATLRAICANGGTVATSGTAARPVAVPTLNIGCDNPNITQLNGWMRRARYWPRALSASELQSVTT